MMDTDARRIMPIIDFSPRESGTGESPVFCKLKNNTGLLNGYFYFFK